jgi:hypothetical protein
MVRDCYAVVWTGLSGAQGHKEVQELEEAACARSKRLSQRTQARA